MIELTRRWFMFGSAAAIAAATIPEALASAQIEACIAQHAFRKRLVSELHCTFDWRDQYESDGIDCLPDPIRPARVRMFRSTDLIRPILQVNVSQTFDFMWRANPGDEIVVLPTSTISLDVESQSVACQIFMFCLDWIDDGPPVGVMESHIFPRPLLAPTIEFLHTDNSLKARLARRGGDQ